MGPTTFLMSLHILVLTFFPARFMHLLYTFHLPITLLPCLIHGHPPSPHFTFFLHDTLHSFSSFLLHP
ncbi:hypothetical protein BDQ17DRAFT_1377401 [Cyathus striatus]|nr:hypothetical protein BDQ17DRAFT_1377401 [Cyathus striatus]